MREDTTSVIVRDGICKEALGILIKLFGSHHSGIPIYSPISMSLVSLEGVRGWLEILKMLGKTDRKRQRLLKIGPNSP